MKPTSKPPITPATLLLKKESGSLVTVSVLYTTCVCVSLEHLHTALLMTCMVVGYLLPLFDRANSPSSLPDSLYSARLYFRIIGPVSNRAPIASSSSSFSMPRS